jgi:hypothetical protein
VLVGRAVLFAIAVLLAPAFARADDGPLASTKRRGFAIESVETALTAYEQDGVGYQSQAGPLMGPGSQRLTVFQPQLLVVARQSERVTHRLWLPVDVVTSASANALDSRRLPPDVISQASRQNQAFTLDWTATYEAPSRARGWWPSSFSASTRNAVHVEENFRSWGTGVGATMSFADDNATIAANANQVLDWFTRYDALGFKHGRATRSTTNGNVGFTQILGPTTIAHANYGVSAQYGELSNTWNTVPFVGFERDRERVRGHRIRHAVVGRFAQFLPWNGALKGFCRFYADGWGIVAHAAEAQLLQRLSPWLYVRGSYRFYTQTAASFFTTLADREARFVTADSDLGRFDSHTAGFKLSVDLPVLFRGAHVDAGYERYWRTDGLTVNVALWQAGARF